MIYRLNENWKVFEPVLRAELQKLGATAGEVESVLRAAWDAATEVDDVAKFAADELELIRQ